MPVVNVEYAKEAEELKATEASFYRQDNARKMRNLRRQIMLVALALTAFMMRFGIPLKDQPMVAPSNATTPVADALDGPTWYEHPVTLYVFGVLMAPVVMLAIVVAAEPTQDKVPFFTVLNRKYCNFLRGMFLVSILVDSTQLFIEANPPATLYSALHSYLQGNEWIDPYTGNENLWSVSYQATITGFTACYCLMLINKSLSHRFAKRTFPNVMLRAASIGFVIAVVVLVSADCYFAYYAKSRDFVQFYYVSVIMGMAIAILEVQGKKEYEAPLKRYRVIMRKVRNGGKGNKDDSTSGIDLSNLKPLDKQSTSAKKIEKIAMQCYQYCKQPDTAFKNYPFTDSRLNSLYPLLSAVKDELKEEDNPSAVKLDVEPDDKDSVEQEQPEP